MASQNKTNLSTLGTQLTKELNKIRVNNSEKAKEIALKVLVIAIERTKIDTSRAQSNWQVSVNSPDESFVKAHYYGFHGSTQIQSMQESISIAKKILDTKKERETIFITNNIDKEGASEKIPPVTYYDRKTKPKNELYVANAEVLEAESEAYTEGLTLAAVANALVDDK